MEKNECNLPKDWIELVKEAMTANITKRRF